MRFCPFCSAENIDSATNCRSCARKLPLISFRRRGNGGNGEADNASSTDDTGARKAASLASIAPGPASLKRKAPPAQPRKPGQPARRATDVVIGSGDKASDGSRATPPAPSRRGRDRRAAAEASRTIPLPGRDGRRKPTTLPPPIPPRRPKSEPADADDWASDAANALGELDDGPTKIDNRIAPERLPSPPPAPEPEPEPEPAPALERDPEPARQRDDSSWGGPHDSPPATVLRPRTGDDRRLSDARVDPIPEVPERGLLSAVAYAWSFFRARRQRNLVIKRLDVEIERQTSDLDEVLGALGKKVRELKLDNSVLSAENKAIDKAIERLKAAHDMAGELEKRTEDENVKFTELEAEREKKLIEAEARLSEAQTKRESYEGQNRALRDKRKELERRHKGYVKASEDRERQAGKADANTAALRRSAKELRQQARALEPERADVERRLTQLEKPLSRSLARVEEAKVERDTARQALNDARAGHRQRIAEIDAEHTRRERKLAEAEGEIERRMVTLGTLINLHRVDHPVLSELYSRIDVLRNAISSRTSEIEVLTAEREEYDRGAVIRGFVVIGCVVLGVLGVIAILLAVN